ncbi:MAG: hypothetical protein GXP62_20440 [Oligoflexia bacterium]|nr:hypothetical protein [Oligoflexia bacterium]
MAAAWLDDWLRDQLRVQRGITYSPWARTRQIDGGGGLLEASARVQLDSTEQALHILLVGMNTLSLGPPQIDLARLKRVLAQRQALTLATPIDATDLLVAEAVSPGTLARRSRWPTLLAAVGPDQVAAAVQDCVGHEVITVTGDEANAQLAIAAIQTSLAAAAASTTTGTVLR